MTDPDVFTLHVVESQLDYVFSDNQPSSQEFLSPLHIYQDFRERGENPWCQILIRIGCRGRILPG